MSGASLLTLLDDIATVLDDVALMTKVAAKKTAGVLGDDLALNAEQVNGVRAERELPVVWAVAVGSLKNKLIIVPAALLLSTIAPWAIMPLLMVGGAYLCYEGFEKLAHKYLHSEAEDEAHHIEIVHALEEKTVDFVAFEKEKIQGAIRTDFVLSGEIIIIALGTVADAVFSTRLAVLAGVGVVMTFGVYGFVALIVKLDDMGFYLQAKSGTTIWRQLQRSFGAGLVSFAPRLMRALTVIGTAAMFLVGGGILTHGIPMIGTYSHAWAHAASEWTLIGGVVEIVLPSLIDAASGIVAGALVLLGMIAINRIFRRK